jgi:hypothetical protein
VGGLIGGWLAVQLRRETPGGGAAILRRLARRALYRPIIGNKKSHHIKMSCQIKN